MDIPIWQNLIIYLNCIYYISFFSGRRQTILSYFKEEKFLEPILLDKNWNSIANELGNWNKNPEKKMKFDFLKHSVRRKSTSWPMKNVRWRPPCFYTPKVLYNSRSRKTAQLGTTKIPATDKNVSPLSLPPK